MRESPRTTSAQTWSVRWDGWWSGRRPRVCESARRWRGGVGDERCAAQLRRLLADGSVCSIAVEHRDRLARLGSESIEAALLGSGQRLLVMEKGEHEDDLVRDMTAVLTSLCARLHGRRSARIRAQRALRCAEREV
jgi:putative resolvase